jgi:hypothetical protein
MCSAAAVFWFFSASTPPPMITYWGVTPDSDPILCCDEVFRVNQRMGS